jgi:hypothetical protein
MTSPNDNDKNKDAATDAKASGGEHKADKHAAAKETLTKIINKTGILVGKIFAVSKAATKDVVQELRNVNNIRKETVATAAEGTKKTDLAKTFWTKTSGKQRGIVIGLTVIIVFALYSAISTSGEQYHKEAEAFYKNKNYAKALELYKKSTDKGYPKAFYNIGVMYTRGEAVPQNFAEAAKWYQLAAAKGNADGQYSHGANYLSGIGVEKNVGEALRWINLAASQNYVPAQLFFALAYQEGKIVEKDYVRSLMWLNILAVSGDQKLIDTRNHLSKNLTPQQVANAQDLATQCKKNDLKNCNTLKPATSSSANVQTQNQTQPAAQNQTSTQQTIKNNNFALDRNLPRPLSQVRSEVELIAACVAHTEHFIEAAKGTAFKTNEAQFWLSGWRAPYISGYTKEWETYRNQWIEKLNNAAQDVGLHLAMSERCQRDYPDPLTKLNLIENSPPTSCSQQCTRRLQVCLRSTTQYHPSAQGQAITACRNHDFACRGSGVSVCN